MPHRGPESARGTKPDAVARGEPRRPVMPGREGANRDFSERPTTRREEGARARPDEVARDHSYRRDAWARRSISPHSFRFILIKVAGDGPQPSLESYANGIRTQLKFACQAYDSSGLKSEEWPSRVQKRTLLYCFAEPEYRSDNKGLIGVRKLGYPAVRECPGLHTSHAAPPSRARQAGDLTWRRQSPNATDCWRR